MPSRNAPSARKDTVATAVQADEPSRLVRVGKPSWEVLIDRLEYNMPAWNASNWIVKHNLKIIRHVQHIQDYEMGKRSDPPRINLMARGQAGKHSRPRQIGNIQERTSQLPPHSASFLSLYCR